MPHHNSFVAPLSLIAFALFAWMAPAQAAERGLGGALPIGQPGNIRYDDTVSITVVLDKVDSPIVAVQWANRVDLGTGNTGYSIGNGGEISIRARKVTSIDNGRLSLGNVIGETDKILNPVLRESWTTHWQRAGGSGTASVKFRDYPTLRFKSPVNLGSAGLKVGDLLAFEFVQHRPTSGAVSVNVAHAEPWNFGTLRSFTNVLAEYRIFKARGDEQRKKVAMILFSHQDGIIKGNPWVGLSGSSHNDVFDFSGSSDRIRQVIPITSTGQSVKRIRTMAVRTTSNASHDLIIELREAGSNPGGSSDEGRLFYSGSVSASRVTQAAELKHYGGVVNDLVVTPPNPIALSPGKTYYIVARSGGTSTKYRMQKLHRYLNQAEVGLKTPDFLYSGIRGQLNTGSGWANITGGAGSGPRNDAPLWIEF